MSEFHNVSNITLVGLPLNDVKVTGLVKTTWSAFNLTSTIQLKNGKVDNISYDN